MDPVITKVDPEVKDPATTAEQALEKLEKMHKAVADDTISREKFADEMKGLGEQIRELRADMLDRMRFDVGDTRAIVAEGGMKALMLSPTKDERVKRLQEMSDDIHIIDALMSSPHRKGEPYGGMKSLKSFGRYSEEYSEFARAMDTATSGSGAEWVPAAGLSGEMMRAIELKQRIAALIPSYQMPHDTHKRPLLTSYGTAYRATENIDYDSMTAATRTTLGTDDILFTAEKIMGFVVWTAEMDEDSIIAMLPEIKAALAIAHARAFDYAIIDGQITGVIDTGDDPSGTASDVRNCWDGIRYYCSTNSTMVDLGSAWNGEGILSVRKKLGVAGVYPDECVWIPSVSNYYSLLALKDAAGAQLVMSMDKVGAAATVLTGQLGVLFGTPVVPSEFIREDLNASGIHDGVTETKTVLPIIHLPGWKIGRYKNITVQTDKEIKNDVLLIVTRERADFQAMMPYATQCCAALGYNITP